jgi:peptide chain release factor
MYLKSIQDLEKNMVSKEKWEEIGRRMQALSISEEELEEKFILGSGSGGQKVNKTSSCVYLKHEPSGVMVKCQKERSRELNRLYARRELCKKIEEIRDKKNSESEQERQKIRRQKKRRSRKSKEKMLADKKDLSKKKNLRKPPSY